jgi:hypothetical protein
MSDDPRGHDDGDVFVGSAEERASVLRVQLKITILMLAEEMGYSPKEIADELIAEAHVLRHGVKKE